MVGIFVTARAGRCLASSNSEGYVALRRREEMRGQKRGFLVSGTCVPVQIERRSSFVPSCQGYPEESLGK